MVVPIARTESVIRPHSPGLSARLDGLAAWLPWLWLVGSPLTFAWPAPGLAGAERLRRQRDVVTDGELPRLCRELGRELGIAREVAVAVCQRLATPVLVGVVRPLILLPVTAMGGWSPEQIEMVRLHELAHVRRWDNLVNLFQRLVESALFFHPAVWLISDRVRREREHCCDRIVVARTGRARAYAETLLALAVPETDRAARAAVAMTRNQLVLRIRQILHPREEHPMKLSRSLIIAVGAAVIVGPAFWIGALAQSQPPSKAQPKQKSATDVGKEEKADKTAAIIQGQSVADWIAALKDRDPAVRKRAVRVLGEVLRDQSGDQSSEIRARILGVMIDDKDEGVRTAAATAGNGLELANAPAIENRVDAEQERAVEPTSTPIRLIDAQGRPVAGAVVAEFFWRDRDQEPTFTPPESSDMKTSELRREIALKLGIPGHLDGASVYAIRQGKGRPLVGLHKVSREEIGKAITVTMHPACRVLFRIESMGLPALEKKYHAELAGPGWWRAAYLKLGDDVRAPRPLFTSSTTGELELLLPPGRFAIYAYGSDVKSVDRRFEVKAEEKELFLGTFDLAPSRDAEQGRFPSHYRMRSNDDDGGKTFVFRRSHSRALHGIARGVVDVGFSPDGKILATAHSYNADSGEVKLWDSNTGAQLATLAVPDEGIASLAFSPDGKFLAGRTHALVERPASWGIVLWDVAARREVRRFRGHTGSISAMAFSPDGRTLVSSGGDKTTRFWDVATGREDGRIDNLKAWGREAAFSPDGRMLALSNGSQINLWDVPGNRLRASLEPPIERSSVYSIAYAPDGRTLAAAGTMYDQKANSQLARVWLYDVAREPFRLRATLTFDPEVAAMPNESPPLCSDVAFTPDGRRVVAAAMQMVLIWDAATGIGESASGRSPASGSSDQIAIPPDGRWLAITRPFGISIVDIPPSP